MSGREKRKAALDARHEDIRQRQADLLAEMDGMDPLIAARRAKVLADEAAALADEYERFLEDDT